METWLVPHALSMKDKDYQCCSPLQFLSATFGTRLSFCKLILVIISLCQESITFSLNFLFSCVLWDTFRTKGHYHIIFLLSHLPPPFQQDPGPISPVIASNFLQLQCRLWDVEETYPERWGKGISLLRICDQAAHHEQAPKTLQSRQQVIS